MTIVEFSPSIALIGGALIGLSAVAMMLTIGRIAGISSIFASLLKPLSTKAWQWAFVLGLISSGLAYQWLYRPILVEIESQTLVLVIAGLLVGFGTRLGNGCTSGHGVCGISRLSPRSIVSTLVFIGSGVATVIVFRLFS